MLQESKDVIIKNFVTLMKECDVQVLKDILINKKVFSLAEINYIFSTDDERHNKRVFFFSIQKKEQGAFNKLIEALKETNQRNIAQLLAPQRHTGGTKVFCFPPDDNEQYVSATEPVEIHVNPNETPLKIQVRLSNQFYDTIDHNKAIYFYSSRSKKRGRLLVINNYKYVDDKHEYRNGAKVDNANLQELFTQMGGWDIRPYDNKTGEEMKILVTQFAQDPQNGQYDICFVIIMGHGNVSEISNETIIYGIDGKYITTNDVQNKFTNEKCKGFRGKPKIFLFQVCRGEYLDYTIRHTETDSLPRHPPSNAISNKEVLSTNIRTQEDMLIGYATLHGYKAHRDPYRGSWYIELICDKFMNFAHNYSVGELLQLVDQDLRKRMSEKQTMQTAEHSFKGFHKLYLNPGIYFEDGVKKHFHAK